MYYLSNGHNYIGLDAKNVPTTVATIKKALSFNQIKKALNFKENLKLTLKKFNWDVVEISDDSNQSKPIKFANYDTYCGMTDYEKANDPLTVMDTVQHNEEPEEYIYESSQIFEDFDIIGFFEKTITTMSQLQDYANEMRRTEHEYDQKIKDVRHYKRDEDTRLNAIQLQRLEKFEIQLERERYECKSNKLIAELFLDDISNIKNPDYIDKVKFIKESKYVPRVLTYEVLDQIVGKV